MTNNNKDKTEPEVKTDITLHSGLAFLDSLDEKTRNNVALLVHAVAKTKINSFVADELADNLLGSEKALFLLGTVAGQNKILRQLKVILSGSAA